MLDKRVTPDSISKSRQSATLAVPSVMKSAGMNFAEVATALPRAGYDIVKALRGLPAHSSLDDSFEVFNKAMETPNERWGQKTVDFFAAGIGYLSPTFGIAAVPASMAVKGGAKLLAKSLPAAGTALARTPIRNFGLKMLPKTVGGAGTQIAEAMAVGTAVTAPEALLDNYNKKTGKFELYGAAKQAFQNGLLTVALDAGVVGAGMVFGKHKKLFGKEYENPMPGDTDRMAEFDKAFKNEELSAEDHDFIKSYITEPKNTQLLKDKAMKILDKEGHPLDIANKTMLMNIIKKEHYDDFHTGMLDQISSGASGDHAFSLSDYIASSGMDFMVSENSEFLDGIGGWLDFMGKRLEKGPGNLEAFRKHRANSSLDHINADHELSQKNVFKRLKDVDYDLQQLPHAIPENMQFRARQERQISKLSRDINRFKRLSKRDPSYEEKIDNASAKLRELRSNKQKLMHPNDELKHLESHFLDRKILPDNYQLTHEYQRLVDLSHVSTKADGLLHHIDLKHQYEIQTAYKDMIGFLHNVIGSNVNKFADPHKVVNYMKARYDMVAPTVEDTTHVGNIRNQNDVPIDQAKGAFSDKKPSEDIKDIERNIQSGIQNDEQLLQDGETDVTQAKSPEYEKEYKVNKERYTQFKGSQGDLSLLVSCELGSRGEV